MPLPWADEAIANLPRGESHPAWKGDDATVSSKYERARKLYPAAFASHILQWRM